MLDILIKNGAVVDGTGKPVFKADVGIAAGRIAVVAETVEQKAKHTIEAQGLHLAPGFDSHTHSDLTLLINRRAESKIRQGVTTEVIGNCGGSPAPLLGAAVEEARAGRHVGEYGRIFGTSAQPGACPEPVEGTAVNVVPLVGHNTVRGAGLFGSRRVEPHRPGPEHSRRAGAGSFPGPALPVLAPAPPVYGGAACPIHLASRELNSPGAGCGIGL